MRSPPCTQVPGRHAGACGAPPAPLPFPAAGGCVFLRFEVRFCALHKQIIPGGMLIEALVLVTPSVAEHFLVFHVTNEQQSFRFQVCV